MPGIHPNPNAIDAPIARRVDETTDDVPREERARLSGYKRRFAIIYLGLALAAAYYAEGGNLTNAGLGAAGRRAIGQNADALWATIVTMVALGALMLAGLSALERLVLRWHVSQRARADA